MYSSPTRTRRSSRCLISSRILEAIEVSSAKQLETREETRCLEGRHRGDFGDSLVTTITSRASRRNRSPLQLLQVVYPRYRLMKMRTCILYFFCFQVVEKADHAGN